MRILIIGSGGREHALAWKFAQSSSASKIFVAPGNGGTIKENVENIAIAVDNIEALVDFALEKKIDLVVPGPELPLTMGIVDAMQVKGIACFGPDKYCAQLEGSKAFAKEIMAEANVPTAYGIDFDDYDEAVGFVKKHGAPIVIKADGLAAGKGVVVAHSVREAIEALEDIMLNKVHGEAGNTVVIEEYLEGEEVSFLCFCDGKHAIALPSSQDHKAIFDNDEGANTGGMGAYSPAPILPKEHYNGILNTTILPILNVLAKKGHPFKGILYAGLMMTEDGPKVLEYNTRFGDPECQPLLMRLKTPLDTIMMACINGTLDKIEVKYHEEVAVGIVLASDGYPFSYKKGMEINGIEDALALGNVKVFHSGTEVKDNKIYANGGRVLCVTALGSSLKTAQEKAYAAIAKIDMDEAYYRKDIALKGIKRLEAVSDKVAKVAIFMGSISDEAEVSPCTEILKKLNIPFFFTVTSAHRTPERTESLVSSLEKKGVEVFICAAGMAAHLAGAVAARTIKPVIGIPIAGATLAGADALYSTVQMPPGFPVATVATNKAGARNAAWLAAQILALQDPTLKYKIMKARDQFKADVEKVGDEIIKKYQ